MVLLQSKALCFYLLIFIVSKTSIAGTQHIGYIDPGFQASQTEWADHDGMFLLSKSSIFGLRFYRGVAVETFLLVIIHIYSAKVVWTANRNSLVDDSDKFVFDSTGNVYLKSGDRVVWETKTTGEKATSLALLDSGNLVLLGEHGRTLWQSFSNPTDTLLPGQEFVDGMNLKSYPKGNKSYFLDFKSGDLVLYVGYQTPQTYWSLADERWKANQNITGKIHSASLVSNSWNFFDEKKVLLWQLNFSENSGANATWAATLGADGAIQFYNLQKGNEPSPEAIKIPKNSCSIPEHCGQYDVCFFDNFCKCPPLLVSEFNCKPPIVSNCSLSNILVDLFHVGERFDYFAIGFVTPDLSSNLGACKDACLRNCSCTVLFYENGTGNCFLFDQIGGFQRAKEGGYISYLKVSNNSNSLLNPKSGGSKKGRMHALLTVIIVFAAILAIVGLLYAGVWYHRKQKRLPEFADLEEDNILGTFSGMPVRFTYSQLRKATRNFSQKVGQGGFGSVYLGLMPDGTRLAVKKLEGIGQGKKEFRAEVKIIGSIHHVHLVKLKGFCAERVHRLLVYEFMGKGSLDKWIFPNKEDDYMLDWNTRFDVALGTAKGLAYLHEECDFKIVHCDIKPENVLLDDNFTAKVSDFGLAKLMNREESLVYTTLRGTRGYLAPEWITNSPISEKSDVYSYGLVLLEIIGGRKNYVPGENSEKEYFPCFAFQMLEEGKLREIVDPRIEFSEDDERVVRAIKVALWCIQSDMHLRPPMTKVVQILEGLCDVAQPPKSPLSGSGAKSDFALWSSGRGTLSGLFEYRSHAFSSDIQLSGPR